MLPLTLPDLEMTTFSLAQMSPVTVPSILMTLACMSALTSPDSPIET